MVEVTGFGPNRDSPDGDRFRGATPGTANDGGSTTPVPRAGAEDDAPNPPVRLIGTIFVGWLTFLAMRLTYQMANRAAKVRYRSPGCQGDPTSIRGTDNQAVDTPALCVDEVRRVEWVAAWRADATWAVLAVGAVILTVLWISVPRINRRPERPVPESTWKLERADWILFVCLITVGSFGWLIGLISTFSFPPGPGLSPADPWLKNAPTAILTIGVSVVIGVGYAWIFGWKRWTPTAEERRRDERTPWFRLGAAAAAWSTAGLVALVTIQPGAGQRPWFSATLQFVAMVYAAVTAGLLTKRAGLRR